MLHGVPLDPKGGLIRAQAGARRYALVPRVRLAKVRDSLAEAHGGDSQTCGARLQLRCATSACRGRT